MRLSAIQVALDRGFGKATQAVELEADAGISRIERVIISPGDTGRKGVPAPIT